MWVAPIITSILLRDNRETSDYSKGVGRCEEGKGHNDVRRSQEEANEANCRSWKRQENRFSSRASRRNQLCQHLAFRPETLSLDF